MEIGISRRQGLVAFGATMGATLLGASFADLAKAAPAEESPVSKYLVRIQMSQETVNSLNDGGYYLFGLHAVNTQTKGEPTVWVKANNFGKDMKVGWKEKYAIYTSTLTTLDEGTTIESSNPYPAALGNKLVVDSNAGTGGVKKFDVKGMEGALGITNNQKKPFTGGICTVDSRGEYQPLGAFTINGRRTYTFTPVVKTVFFFGTDEMDAGTVLTQAVSDAINIDLTKAAKGTRAVKFDINEGWSWDRKLQEKEWGSLIESGDSLRDLLILSKPSD